MKHANYVTLKKSPPIAENTTHKVAEKTQTAALGEQCRANVRCSETNAECSQGRCACSDGFIQKGPKCVKSVCPKPDFQFQCDDLSKTPHCVAIYDTCNGIAQCGDASDEENCEAIPSKGKMDGEQSSPDLSSAEDRSDSREASPPHGTRKQLKPKKKKKKKTPTPTAASAPKKPPHKAAVTIFANASFGAQSKPAERAKTTSEYVEMLQRSYQQSKIAVVVLGLTLAVTGLALTFFVCRIRRIKNRLRRGKALTSDEADYLINGMYL